MHLYGILFILLIFDCTFLFSQAPLHKGWLVLIKQGPLRAGGREFFFVLSRDNFAWYSDEDVSAFVEVLIVCLSVITRKIAHQLLK